VTAPGAVVLGGDYQGLGIVRSLGRAGVPVVVIDEERSIAKYSRYAERAVRVRAIGDPERTPDLLLQAADDLGVEGWVLFPTLDETVALISRNLDRLSGAFRVVTPSWDQIRWAWDKRNTYQLAEELGVPFPRTWRPGGIEGLKEIDCSRPLVVKPAIKEHFIYATKAKAWRAETRSDLERLFRRAEQIITADEILIQELVPGDGRNLLGYCAFVHDGVPVATMVARRWRQHPPDFGRASTYVESIEDPTVESHSRAILARLRYSGLVELEYKVDPADGSYKLLDFNARTWGYHTLGAKAGVDFPLLQYRHAVGETVEPQRARSGVRWIRLLTDTPTAFVEMYRRRLSVRQYVRSLARADTDAVFARDDPLPGIAECLLAPYLIATRGF
jgi:predicted ATP-grasp superfamily ATP-dependent carboligase